MSDEFECPLCGHVGAFQEYRGRANARCPVCRSLERMRHQWLIARDRGLLDDAASRAVLHVAPEPCVAKYLRAFGRYIGFDTDSAREIDIQGDLCAIALEDACVDVVWASHVLEHIREVDTAIAEIHRVMKPGGVAVIEIPIVGEKTVLFDTPGESDHWWGPGVDWYDKYREVGFTVEVLRAADAPKRFRCGGGEVAWCVKS